jgi:hypothetical protein
MAISFIKAGDGTISAFVAGKSYIIPTNHSCYNDVLEALKKDDEKEFIKFADLKQRVESFGNDTSVSSSNLIEIKGDLVYYKGKELHNVITNKILSYIREGLNHSSLINFLNKLMKNPSKHSVDQLFNFLENKFLPIHEDGDFFGYKRVRSDYLDFYSGKILNKVGTTVEVERNSVDDDYSVDCSYGLHVGSRDYVKGFHNEEDSRVLLVKVNPADVVSVPKYDVTKMRVCKYFVFEELDNKDFGIDATVYSPRPSSSFVQSDEDDEDDEDDDCFFPSVVSDEEIEDDWDDEEDDEEDFDFEDEEDDNYDLSVEADEDIELDEEEVNYSDLSEWIEEVSQGTMKENLSYAVKKAVPTGSCFSYVEAFLNLSKFIHNEENQSLINFINKTDVRVAFEEIYSVTL